MSATLRIRQAILQFEAEVVDYEKKFVEKEVARSDDAIQESHSPAANESSQILKEQNQRISELTHQIDALQGAPYSGWSDLAPEKKIDVCIGVLDGWCTAKKANWLTDFIHSRAMKSVVEIGVFGGKSLIPMVLALQSTGGKAIGVEPWSNQTAVEEQTNAANDEWWRTVDLGLIKTRFFFQAARLNALKNLTIMETDSDAAFQIMKDGGRSLDMVHIDGAHSPERALKDAVNWSSLVRKGGVVVFDDIAWESVRAAREFLTNNFKVLDEVIEPDHSSYGAYEV